MEKEELLAVGKAMLVFIAIGFSIHFTRRAGYFEAAVAMMYLASAIYVFLYFREDAHKWIVLYFYAGLMVLCILVYKDIYLELGVIDSSDGKNVHDMNDLLYFSIVTWTTLGYGDFRPSPDARLFAASQAILGYVYMSILVAKFFRWMGLMALRNTQEYTSNN